MKPPKLSELPDTETLTLKRAAQVSGWSQSTIRRLKPQLEALGSETGTPWKIQAGHLKKVLENEQLRKSKQKKGPKSERVAETVPEKVSEQELVTLKIELEATKARLEASEQHIKELRQDKLFLQDQMETLTSTLSVLKKSLGEAPERVRVINATAEEATEQPEKRGWWARIFG